VSKQGATILAPTDASPDLGPAANEFWITPAASDDNAPAPTSAEQPCILIFATRLRGPPELEVGPQDLAMRIRSQTDGILVAFDMDWGVAEAKASQGFFVVPSLAWFHERVLQATRGRAWRNFYECITSNALVRFYIDFDGTYSEFPELRAWYVCVYCVVCVVVCLFVCFCASVCVCVWCACGVRVVCVWCFVALLLLLLFFYIAFVFWYAVVLVSLSKWVLQSMWLRVNTCDVVCVCVCVCVCVWCACGVFVASVAVVLVSLSKRVLQLMWLRVNTCSVRE
jgi:hypothetical protein